MLPFTRVINPNPCAISFGCSLGAYHAMNIALRHPSHFGRVVAFSGRYDLARGMENFRDLLDGYYDDDVYFNMPNHYLPQLEDPGLLAELRRMDITFTVGEEDPFLADSSFLSQVMGEKGMGHAFHVWQGRAHAYRDWRNMIALYL